MNSSLNFISLAGGYGIISFSYNCRDVLNYYDKEPGFTGVLNFGKEWLVLPGLGLGIGVQGLISRTQNCEILNFNINGSVSWSLK